MLFGPVIPLLVFTLWELFSHVQNETGIKIDPRGLDHSTGARASSAGNSRCLSPAWGDVSCLFIPCLGSDSLSMPPWVEHRMGTSGLAGGKITSLLLQQHQEATASVQAGDRLPYVWETRSQSWKVSFLQDLSGHLLSLRAAEDGARGEWATFPKLPWQPFLAEHLAGNMLWEVQG